MAVISNRIIGITFAGDVDAPNLAYNAAENAASPGQVTQQVLASGVNSISVPVGAVAMTIIPPAANTVAIVLKGTAGDTGIALHLTDPTSIAILRASTPTVVLTATGAVTVRVIWS